MPSDASVPPRITSLKIQNYRVLRNVELKEIKPFCVFVGANGSGKSTIFDVFAFLSECFSSGLRRAWDRRGRFRELRSRGREGEIQFEIKYREDKRSPVVTYILNIDEDRGGPFVSHEILSWRRGSRGRPFKFLEFRSGNGSAVSGDVPDSEDSRTDERLTSREMLAVNTLGQFEKHPRVTALRDFVTGWHLSYLSVDDPRGSPEAGPQEHLSRTGDNLANVIQYLSEQHPNTLKMILDRLATHIPMLEHVEATKLEDGRLLLKFKDKTFLTPVLPKYVSDGTIKLLAYLVLLQDPAPASLIGIEEPENFFYPGLLADLAEECQIATANTQIMATTHSPQFLSALSPEAVWVLNRGDDGFTSATRVSEICGVPEMTEAGALLSDLWMEKYFTQPVA